MTPKEQASELVKRFYNLFADELENTIHPNEAVECAKLCCDYVIKQDEAWNAATGHGGGMFWKAVKKELETVF